MTNKINIFSYQYGTYITIFIRIFIFLCLIPIKISSCEQGVKTSVPFTSGDYVVMGLLGLAVGYVSYSVYKYLSVSKPKPKPSLEDFEERFKKLKERLVEDKEQFTDVDKGWVRVTDSSDPLENLKTFHILASPKVKLILDELMNPEHEMTYDDIVEHLNVFLRSDGSLRKGFTDAVISEKLAEILS